jgi:hypothetical protein
LVGGKYAKHELKIRIAVFKGNQQSHAEKLLLLFFVCFSNCEIVKNKKPKNQKKHL